MREESCGGHFREEHQAGEGEASRNDIDYTLAGVWEYKEKGKFPFCRRKFSLENVALALVVINNCVI